MAVALLPAGASVERAVMIAAADTAAAEDFATEVFGPRQSAIDAGGTDEAAAPLREIIRRPGVLTALVAAIASFAGMVSVMNLTGYLVIDHGHHQSDVFTVISLHIVGMYALVLVIGQVVDAVGRRPGEVAGLLARLKDAEREIARANGVVDPRRLRPGAVLVIPRLRDR